MPQRHHRSLIIKTPVTMMRHRPTWGPRLGCLMSQWMPTKRPLMSKTSCSRLVHRQQRQRRRQLLVRWLHSGRSAWAAVEKVASTKKSAWSRLSRRDHADLEDFLFKNVPKQVRDPILNENLDRLGWFQPRVSIHSTDGTLTLMLRIPSMLHPQLAELRNRVKETAQQELLKWKGAQGVELPPPSIVVTTEPVSTPLPVMVKMVDDPDSQEELIREVGPGLAQTAHLVAVYSCKGGVGKSTVAVNLAYELVRQGGRVGLVDVDVYGPSLPLLVRPNDRAVRSSSIATGIVEPIEHYGSGVPASGEDNGAAVLRGPLAVKVVQQLVKGTNWGDLDILILDMPPGTGDVQLSILQDFQLSGAIAVTTPSKLALADTRKGVQMFTSLGVPTIATVQNLSYFEIDGTKHFPFGRGLSNSVETFVSDDAPLIEMPVSMLTTTATDEGVPICLSRPSSAHSELSCYEQLSREVCGALLKLQYGNKHQHTATTISLPDLGISIDPSLTVLNLNPATKTLSARLFSDTGAVNKQIGAAALRCRDPRTGEVLDNSPFLKTAEEELVNGHIDEAGVRKTIPGLSPNRVTRRGTYGFAVVWDDGATIIYTVLSIARAAGGIIDRVH